MIDFMIDDWFNESWQLFQVFPIQSQWLALPMLSLGLLGWWLPSGGASLKVGDLDLLELSESEDAILKVDFCQFHNVHNCSRISQLLQGGGVHRGSDEDWSTWRLLSSTSSWWAASEYCCVVFIWYCVFSFHCHPHYQIGAAESWF